MSYRRLMDEGPAARSLEIQPLLETSDTELLCQLVSQGLAAPFSRITQRMPPWQPDSWSASR